jgi:hypothetical protein
MAMFYVEVMANSHASNMVLPWFYHEPFSYGMQPLIEAKIQHMQPFEVGPAVILQSLQAYSRFAANKVKLQPMDVSYEAIMQPVKHICSE